MLLAAVKLGLKRVFVQHHSCSPVSSAPDGVCPRDHTVLCLNAGISRRMGIPLNHHLSKSQELFRMKTFFLKEAKSLVLTSGGGDGGGGGGGVCVCGDGGVKPVPPPF